MDSKKQLLARVWRPLLRKFGEATDKACLRRDAFLDRVLAHEAQAIREEVPCNSPEARSYLQELLGQLDRQPVNFTVSAETIALVNSACEEKNVVRDCFINRVLFLLVATETMCERIIGLDFIEELGEILGDHERDYLYTPLFRGGLAAVSEIVSGDPFRALRNVIEHYGKQEDELATPLHACTIWPEMFSERPPGLLALNCYLPDESIPGSPAAKRVLRQLYELLGEVERPKPNRAVPKDRKDQAP